ncbi:MAG: hypothetical protein ACRDLN_13535 [Solirubrobacteraceae bacterium]
MHITDWNVTLASQYPQGRVDELGVPRERAPEPPRMVAPGGADGPGVYVLDTDHDGWIDEDDVPYDEIARLERERARVPAQAESAVSAIYARTAAATPRAVPDAEVRAPEPEAREERKPEAGPQIDLLA